MVYLSGAGLPRLSWKKWLLNRCSSSCWCTNCMHYLLYQLSFYLYGVPYIFTMWLFSLLFNVSRYLCLLHIDGWLGSLVAKLLDSQLARCEFNSRPRCCRVTTLGKLFTPMCLSRSQWFSDGMIDCSVRGCGQLCLSRQPLRCSVISRQPLWLVQTLPTV